MSGDETNATIVRSSPESAIERAGSGVSKQRLITIQNGQEKHFLFELPPFAGTLFPRVNRRTGFEGAGR